MRNFTVTGAVPEEGDAESAGDIPGCMFSAISRREVELTPVSDWSLTPVVAAIAETAKMIVIRTPAAILDDITVLS